MQESGSAEAAAPQEKELKESQDLALFLEEKAKAEIRALIATYPAAAHDPVVRALEALIQEERGNRYTPGGAPLSVRVQQEKGRVRALRAKIDDLKQEQMLFQEEDPFSDTLFVPPTLGAPVPQAAAEAAAVTGAVVGTVVGTAVGAIVEVAAAALHGEEKPKKKEKGKLFKQGPLPETPLLETLVPYPSVMPKEQLADPVVPVKIAEKPVEAAAPLPEVLVPPSHPPAELAKEHAKEYNVLAQKAHRSKQPTLGRNKGRIVADTTAPPADAPEETESDAESEGQGEETPPPSETP